MKCPRCETAWLDERERDGVVIDVCQGCRGLWLDRGELEKLIGRAPQQEPVRDDRSPRDDTDDDDDRGQRRRRPRWFESLTDLFD